MMKENKRRLKKSKIHSKYFLVDLCLYLEVTFWKFIFKNHFSKLKLENHQSPPSLLSFYIFEKKVYPDPVRPPSWCGPAWPRLRLIPVFPFKPVSGRNLIRKLKSGQVNTFIIVLVFLLFLFIGWNLIIWKRLYQRMMLKKHTFCHDTFRLQNRSFIVGEFILFQLFIGILNFKLITCFYLYERIEVCIIFLH